MIPPRSDYAAASSARTAAAGAAGVAQAFKRALVSQCHPNMLLAVLLPFVIALLGALLLLWLFWTPLTEWLNLQATQWQVVNNVDAWLVGIGQIGRAHV